MNRKDFIRLGGRSLLLGAAALLTITLVRGNRISLEKEKCSDGRFCRKCSRFGACAEPVALKVRNNGK
ncbi:MAG: hypothetical protein ACOYXB_09680 [Bacteroidota bacterium]